VSAVLIALTKPQGMAKGLVNFLERFRRSDDKAVDPDALPPRVRPTGTGLQITDLRVRYGGFVAVDSLTLAAPPGRITALIGPNGAGKTTTFNVCSGLVRPSEGRVHYNDEDITKLGTAARARRGLGRTFQRVELWPSLTVAENVALGAEAPMAGGNFAKQLVARPGEPARTAASVAEAMELTSIAGIAHRVISDLSTGEKRLVELARVLAGPFDLLLLDEPSSGLDTAETERFGAVLRTVVDTRGTGALLVEHDMSFVTQVCDYVYVLDFGTLIFEGTAREAMDSDIVRGAYLGTEAVLATTEER
jgi:ABC-type branched-subunit amino acid transport system ATPase component